MAASRRTMTVLLTAGLISLAGCNLFLDGENNGNGVDARFARFTDPNDASFTTTDVRDVNDEIIRIDTDAMSVVRITDDSIYQEGAWVVNGNFLGAAQAFQVRFGTVGGQKRAYFTETVPATICRFTFGTGTFQISPTNQTVPQN